MAKISNKKEQSDAEAVTARDQARAAALQAKHPPLVQGIYTADPSAHVFNGKLYIYPSHDVENDRPINDNGDHFDMRDYHVYSMENPSGPVSDHGCVLDVADVPWAKRQMWAPDAAEKDGQYYFYFPARNDKGIFQIGVAVGHRPEGPFVPEEKAILGSYSIDPAVLSDQDGSYYLYFGGLWGGQLQAWSNGKFGPDRYPADHEPAIRPRIARLADNMLEFAEDPREIEIRDPDGTPLQAGDYARRFFEGPWVHKYGGRYYLSYSTGDAHTIVYATADSPYGPFTYRGVILTPVLGWTTHHSIVQWEGKWFLFYHDCQLSGGLTHLRNIKMAELFYHDDGIIQTIDPYHG